MAYKVKINNKDVYDLKDGFILRKQYNENLDSGTVSFTSYGKSIDIEPFDGVVIYDTENTTRTNSTRCFFSPRRKNSKESRFPTAPSRNRCQERKKACTMSSRGSATYTSEK